MITKTLLSFVRNLVSKNPSVPILIALCVCLAILYGMLQYEKTQQKNLGGIPPQRPPAGQTN
jgi:hypothetical protein